MRAEILRLQRSLAVTTIYVTHDQTEAMTMGDRVAVMRKGVLQQVAGPQQLYERPANLFVAEFIGSPAMNLVEADLVGASDGLVARFGTHTLRLGARVLSERPALRGYAGRRVILGFRPEDLEDSALMGSKSGDAVLNIVPDIREDMGSEVYVHFALGVPQVHRSEVAEARAPEEDARARVAARSVSPFVARLGRETRAREDEPLELVVDVNRLYVFDADTGDGIYGE
jgi:multiple sugar transport system ATP-binding protein